MEDHNWQKKNNAIEKFKKEPIQSISQLPIKQPDYKNYSVQVSNANRKTQFSLGTYNGVKKTEASSHFKQHDIPKENISISNESEVKNNNFSLGTYSNQYLTTASASFIPYGQQEINHLIKNTSNNISFGDDKIKMASIGQTEFNNKIAENISKEDMNKIKENHRSTHFTVGNIEPSYITTNAHNIVSSISDSKRYVPDTTPHVVFGNYKAVHITEKQENYKKMQIKLIQNQESGSEHKKSHFYMGKETSAPLPTSVEVYQGKQNEENVKLVGKDYTTNINLGSSSRK